MPCLNVYEKTSHLGFFKKCNLFKLRFEHTGFLQFLLAEPLLHLSDWKPLGAGTMVLIMYSSQLSRTISPH